MLRVLMFALLVAAGGAVSAGIVLHSPTANACSPPNCR